VNITTESLEHCQVRLTIEVDEGQARQAMRDEVRQISRQTRIPGFRQGKAPYEVIVQRLGEDTIRQRVADTLTQDLFRQAVEEQDLQIYAPAKLEDVQTDPFVFKYVVSLYPQVDLGDYRAYRLKPQEAKVSEDEIQQALQNLRQQNVLIEPVERPAALNDGAQINVVGHTATGDQFMAQEKIRVVLKGGAEQPTPGFIENIVGMEAGDERSFTLVLPDGFSDESLRGQEVEFTVEVLQVYERTLPDLDDDLARTASNLDSFEELKAQVTEQLGQKAQQEVDQAYTSQVLQDMIEQAQIEYPPEMLTEELDKQVQEMEQAVKQELKLSLEDYLRYQGRSTEELRTDLTPQVQDELERALLLGEVVAREKLTVDEEEINTRIEEISAAWGERADEVRQVLGSQESRASILKQLLGEKAIQRLVAIARGEAPELDSTPEQETGQDEETQVADEREVE